MLLKYTCVLHGQRVVCASGAPVAKIDNLQVREIYDLSKELDVRSLQLSYNHVPEYSRNNYISYQSSSPRTMSGVRREGLKCHR
jgi:hypothetical protein